MIGARAVGMKVLTVENNPELLKLVTHLLEKEGFEALTALTGREAMEVFETARPDIVCLDIGLDDISGYEVCRRMRAADAEMPIIIVTSKSRSVDISEGMEAGATEYIVKPFDIAAFASLLREMACDCLARRFPGAEERSFDFGPLKVYPAALRAERRGRQLDLTLREVRILHFFLEHKGKTVPPDALEAACGKGPGASAVRWHIDQLRRKIEETPLSPQLIRSEGEGYRFG
jgi:two-component system, OmpR family, alkaline phosphatase synthesis response regulator PhoP